MEAELISSNQRTANGPVAAIDEGADPAPSVATLPSTINEVSALETRFVDDHELKMVLGLTDPISTDPETALSGEK